MENKTELEQAAEKYSSLIPYVSEIVSDNSRLDFIAGAKWQAERMFSEDECYKIVHNLMTDIKLCGIKINDDIDLKKWFDKFKNK